MMQSKKEYKSMLGFSENITAIIGYLMGIGALVFFFSEKENHFIRFHAVQAVLYSIGFTFILMMQVLFFSQNQFQNLMLYLTAFVWMLGIVYAVLTAFQSKYFKFPLIGDVTEKWSGTNLEL